MTSTIRVQRVLMSSGVESATVVRDGDVITINAETNEISMDVSDEELQQRLKEWKPPAPNVTRGVLAKYARLVGDASHGAMTDLF